MAPSNLHKVVTHLLCCHILPSGSVAIQFFLSGCITGIDLGNAMITLMYLDENWPRYYFILFFLNCVDSKWPRSEKRFGLGRGCDRSWKFWHLSYLIHKIWHAWDEYLMLKIGMIEQIMRYLIVIVLWQMSEEHKICKCWSYGFWFVIKWANKIIIKQNFKIKIILFY